MANSSQSSTVSNGKFPIDDLTYDVLTILHEKSQGLEAYDKYLQDASSDSELLGVLQQIRQNDAECVQKLQQHLGRLLTKQS